MSKNILFVVRGESQNMTAEVLHVSRSQADADACADMIRHTMTEFESDLDVWVDHEIETPEMTRFLPSLGSIFYRSAYS